MSLIKNNVTLVGMTGVGKTSIGKLLSKKIKKEFLDTDFEIEKASGMKIKDFFKKYGESEFRKLEKKITLKIFENNKKVVISSGAGVFSDKLLNKFLLSKTICIFLNAKTETLLDRLNKNISNRPKLENGKLEEIIEEMYKKRIVYYNNAHIKINVDKLSIQEIVSKIVSKLRNYEKKL